jgi:hypothetical protein
MNRHFLGCHIDKDQRNSMVLRQTGRGKVKKKSTKVINQALVRETLAVIQE